MSPSAAMQERRQLRVGEYCLGDTVGRGASSKVKEAVHVGTGNRVAVKIQQKGQRAEIEARKEVEVMNIIGGASVSDALIHMQDVLESEKYIYLVYEFLPTDLFDVINENKGIHEDEAKVIFERLVMAVGELHAQGVAHRDIKPENILMDIENDKVRLADFGLSYVSKEKDSCPLLTEAVGTMGYAAPEISRIYNPFEADIYSFGSTLFTALTGKFLPKREDFSLDDFPELSATAADLIMALTSPEPETRPLAHEILAHPWFESDFASFEE
eukprot:TRINITY_DN8345_c0_g3_i1.p1 TRINITY_DN8345_c0_g3~~TRINITY_DN8345_c0_g3_i1.p1  ORF type:complete len:290 (+),score=66.49 TRINITY_DN8345_c0_g3_i1:58-870(+)